MKHTYHLITNVYEQLCAFAHSGTACCYEVCKPVVNLMLNGFHSDLFGSSQLIYHEKVPGPRTVTKFRKTICIDSILHFLLPLSGKYFDLAYCIARLLLWWQLVGQGDVRLFKHLAIGQPFLR